MQNTLIFDAPLVKLKHFYIFLDNLATDNQDYNQKIFKFFAISMGLNCNWSFLP
jgi:hypothetical protein